MGISLLEFKIKGNLFGIRTEIIKNIFDIETIKKAYFMPDYVVGVTHYNQYLFPVICTEKLLKLSDRSCEEPVGKTAVVVDLNGKYYALIVDEILKIQEIERTGPEDDIVNFYKTKNDLPEELTKTFLMTKIQVPSFLNKRYTEAEIKTGKPKAENSYLIFYIGEKIFALNTEIIRKVEYLESMKKSVTVENNWIEGVFLIKDFIVKVGSLKKLLNLEDSPAENLVIIEKHNRYFGFTIDEIIDIVEVPKSEIKSGPNPDNILNEFFVYSNEVVPVISDKYIGKIIDEYALLHEKKEEIQENSEEETILIVEIAGEKFAVNMKNVTGVLELNDLHISNYTTKNPFIKGLTTVRNEKYFVVSYEEIIGKEIEKKEDAKLLVLKYNDNLKIALIISEIQDIITVPAANIKVADDDNYFIGGTVVDNKDNFIDLLNINWLSLAVSKNVEKEKLDYSKPVSVKRNDLEIK
ncbi:chemotaxis protein CheW [Persephonella sp.]